MERWPGIAIVAPGVRRGGTCMVVSIMKALVEYFVIAVIATRHS